MRTYTKWTLLLFCCSIIRTGFSQISSDEQLANIIPATPNTAALLKFDNIPVSPYTGIPSISVPMYEISEDGVSVPISLSYHAGGIRVGEEPSAVGLGWALNAGGVISRQVRGAPDEQYNQARGYLYNTELDSVAKEALNFQSYGVHNPLMNTIGSVTPIEFYFLRDYEVDDKKDCIPDIFQFSFMGHSGKFFLDKNAQPVLLENSHLRIKSNLIPGHSQQSIRQFVITDEDGNQYTFGCSNDNQRVAIERSSSAEGFSTAATPDGEPADFTDASASAWHLLDIVTRNGREIKFTYDSYVYSKEIKGMHTLTVQGYYRLGVVTDCPMITLNLTRYFREIRLNNITFDNGIVQFHHDSTTKLFTTVNVFASSNQATPLKRFSFFYNENHIFLDSMRFAGSDSVNVGTYKFEYNTPMPTETMDPNSTYSNAQDYWGYYNGKIANTSLVPNLDYNLEIFSCSGDRNVAPGEAQASSLNKIIYPTGGSQTFFYESNTGRIDPIFMKYFPDLVLAQGRSVGENWSSGMTKVDTIDIAFPGDVQEDGVQKAIITVQTRTLGGPCTPNPTAPHPVNCYADDVVSTIEKLDGTKIQDIKPDMDVNDLDIRLPKGKYLLVSTMTTNPQLGDLISYINILWKDYVLDTVRATPAGEGYVGGLRVKKIVSDDGFGKQSTIAYKYKLFADTSKTSGVMVNFFSSHVIPYINTGSEDYKYLVNSSGNAPLISTSGSPIGYKNVTMLYGENGENGKQEFVYTTADEYPDSNGIEADPYPYPCDYDWRRGLLLSETTYSSNVLNTIYTPVQRLFNQYQFDVRSKRSLAFMVRNDWHNIRNYLIADTTLVPLDPYGPVNGFATYFHVAAVRTSSEFVYKKYDSTVTYDQSDTLKYSSVVNKYDYDTLNTATGDPYYVLRSKKTTNSKGENLETDYQYARDFTGVYDSMDRRNFISPIIRQTQFNNGIQLVQTKSNYKLFSNGLILPDSLEEKIQGNPSEKRIEFQKYDNYGNLQQQRKANDVLNTYIWDYQHIYPVASVINADSSSIAYTSFEADGQGNWSFAGTPAADPTAPTGKNSYTLGSSITKSGLNSSTTYIVSYWKKSGSVSVNGTTPVAGRTVNGWTYYQHQVVNPSGGLITVSGTSGVIDELRLYPAAAQMTSYTYTPLAGVTSTDDPNGEIIYFEYDGFQRLKNVRDYQGNIIKNYQYNYARVSSTPVLAMETMAGTPTISYPVGVFSVNNALLGNATTQAQYVTMWNTDPDDYTIGTLSAGTDSMHFILTLNSGKNSPGFVTGCRYYQYDLAYNIIDGIRNLNGCFVDFGDGARMMLGKALGDTAVTIAPNTTLNYGYSNYWSSWEVYWIHTYPDNTQKTITIYQNDDSKIAELDNYFSPAPSLNAIKNFRGNIPQFAFRLTASCFQQASALTTSAISNWNTINSVRIFQIWPGDGISVGMHVSYPQDFMANNRHLSTILTSSGYYGEGYEDLTFKLSKFKANWNTYFTDLDSISICDDHWSRENLSSLPNLRYVAIFAGNQNHSINSAGNPLVPLPVSVVDNIITQVAAGAGISVTNGYLNVGSGGTARSSASNAAVTLLKSKGWTVIVNNITL